MCRLALYWGPPILISEFVLKPSRSIIKQSYDAKERLSDHTLPFHLGYGNLNGDGSGIGWFANNTCGTLVDTTPCTFTSVTPAWNNDNLNRLAAKLESGLIFAHVRAAYPGMPVSEQNCHPFAYGNYLFMHNGVIAGFLDIRRKLLSELRDEAYNAIQSFHSDSAVSFAVFLHHLPSMTERQPPEAILKATQGAIAMISRIQREHGITDTSLLNFVVSDGQTTVATRYVSNDSQPASLYFAEGSAYERVEPSENANPDVNKSSGAAARGSGGGETGAAGSRKAAALGEADYHLTYGGTDARVCLIASEPVTARASDWVEVPRNTALVVCREKDGLLTVMQSPLTASGEHPRHAEVYRCLEAVLGAANIQGAGSKSQLRLSAAAAAAAVMAAAGGGRHYLSSRPGGGAGGHHGEGEDANPETPRVDTIGHSKLGRRPSTQSLDSLENDIDGGNQDSEHLLTGHRGAVMALCTHGDYLFSGSTDANIKVWCLKDCKYLTTLVGHRDPLRCLAISGSTLISAGAKTVRVWSLVDFSCLAVLAASDIRGSIKALAVTGDGRMYVGGQDCQVKLFLPDAACDVQADSPRCMTELDTVRTVTGVATAAKLVSKTDNGHCSSITCLVLLGKYLCSGSSDSTVRVWDASTLEFVKVLRGHRGSVLALHAVPGLLLSGGRDHLIRVWDADTLVCRRTLAGHSDDILHISSFEIPSANTGSVFERGLSFDMAYTTPANPPGVGLPGSGSASLTQTPALAALLEPTSPRFSGKLTLFATSSADGTIKVWTTKDLSCLHTFKTRGGGRGSGVPSFPRSIGITTPAAIMSCALTSAYATAGLMNGNITMFPVEEVYAEAERSWKVLQRNHTGLQVVSAPNAAAVAAAAATAAGNGTNGPASKRIRISKDATTTTTNGEEEEALTTTAGRLERELEKALRIFIKIKTVSSDPSLSQDCFRGAKFLLRLLESMGAEVKLSQPVEGKNPVVLGRLGVDSSLPTIVYYGHYDVQPAMEPEWTSNPFEVSAVDGYLIARGISDNKGPTLAFIYGVKELLEELGGVDPGKGGGLPCNVVFLIEGEEENGSIGFRDAVQQNLRWFEGTEAVLISNTLWVGEKTPCITYGMRGMITFSVEVRGAAKDLHSGNEGGVFSEPLSDLNKILASLIDSRSNVSVPGFYDEVRPNMLTAALQRLQESSEFSLEGYRKALGIKEFNAGRSERDLLNARWCQPTLSVVDVRVGTAEDADHAHYRFGPTRFSVIPRAAVGKISCRFVPDQKAETLIDHLTTHIQHEFAKLRSGNSISVKVHSVGDWWEANPGSELMQLAEKAVREEWKEVPLLVREGGTMPVASALEKMLDAPALLLPMGQSSDCCHLANERIRKINLIRGKNVIKRFLVAMGEKKKYSLNGGGSADNNNGN